MESENLQIMLKYISVCVKAKTVVENKMYKVSTLIIDLLSFVRCSVLLPTKLHVANLQAGDNLKSLFPIFKKNSTSFYSALFIFLHHRNTKKFKNKLPTRFSHCTLFISPN